MRRKLGLALAALTLAGCSAGGDEAVEEAAQEEDAAVSREAAPEAAEGDAVQASAGAESSLPDLGTRVIQTATLRLSVEEGRFDEAVSRARTVATGLGGFVTGATASQGGDGRLVRGTLEVRVPQDAYAQAMRSLAAIGEVEGREESGRDVSAEFVDLEARERHLEAVERQLLELLERADTVAAALAVQSKLNEVQLELERVRGRLRYLEDQTSFATISLAVHERGVAPPGPGGVWGNAAEGFLDTAGGIVVALATAAPVLLGGLLVLLALRPAVRRLRSGQAATIRE